MAGEVKEVVVLGKTAGGKTVEWYRQGRIGRIRFQEGGQLPKKLNGGFTDAGTAEKAFKSYLAEVYTPDMEDEAIQEAIAAESVKIARQKVMEQFGDERYGEAERVSNKTHVNPDKQKEGDEPATGEVITAKAPTRSRAKK